MKKRFLIALCFFFLLYPLPNGYSEEKEGVGVGFGLQCHEFASMGMFQKLGYVEGWCNGSLAAFEAITSAIMEVEINAILWNKKPISIDSKKYREIADGALREKGMELDYLSIVQITETTNKICSDPRVKYWWIKNVMPIVRGRLKEGWTDKDVDEVIAYYVKLYGLSSRKLTQNEWSEEYRSLELNKPKALKALEAYKEKDKKQK
jgi:hypothetical protein